MNEWMNEWMNEQTSELTNESNTQTIYQPIHKMNQWGLCICRSSSDIGSDDEVIIEEIPQDQSTNQSINHYTFHKYFVGRRQTLGVMMR